MLSKIIVHKVGNKINQEQLFISNELLDLEEDMKEQLMDFFLKAFKSEEQFQFYSDGYLEQNPVYAAVKEIFENPDDFIHGTEKIAQQLFDCVENTRVQSGELFVCYFVGEETNGESIDKIGIFKTENKLPFLKIKDVEDNYNVEKDYGISLSKVDKAAMIYNIHSDTGYALSVVDNNKNGDEYYWFEDFLKVQLRTNEYFHTQETLSVYKDYIQKQLPTEFEVSKIDQAEFMNRSINFFKEKEEFDFDDFSREVLQDDDVIESFANFKADYEQDMQMSIAENFPINISAVKKNQRHFKSVIKLDKNFHIYIHGDRKMIETGEDEKGKYYRLYFNKEE